MFPFPNLILSTSPPPSSHPYSLQQSPHPPGRRSLPQQSPLAPVCMSSPCRSARAHRLSPGEEQGQHQGSVRC